MLYNLDIYKGTTFELQCALKSDDVARNLTGCEVQAHLRTSYESAAYTNLNAQILAPAEGTIKLSLSHTASAVLNNRIRYVYDVLLISDFNLKTIVVEGSVLVRSGITS